MTDRLDNLVVVAHPDDEILGFGATGSLLASEGQSVLALILCGDVNERNFRPNDEDLLSDIFAASRLLNFSDPILGSFPNIKINTIPHIEIVSFIEKYIHQFKPRRVFTHHPRDLNDDHVEVAKACYAAVRLGQRRPDIPMVESVHCMEILSATDWSFPVGQGSFDPNLFIEVNHHIECKLSALHIYRSVMRDFPHPRCSEIIKGLAAYRGGQSGLHYAEAFQTIFRIGL